MSKVNLTNNKGYRWFSKVTTTKSVWVKGFIVAGDKIIREDELAEFIYANDVFALPETLAEFDGQFSIVVEADKYVFAIVDHMRCFPLFYKKCGDGFCVFDTVTQKDWDENKINPKQKQMLICTTFTIENATLFDNYFQIPAGQYLVIQDNDAYLKKYWQFSYAPQQIVDKEKAIDVIYNGYAHLFKLCADIVGDRVVVIPLSGGYDSRLVLNGLLKAGIDKDKIVTFTCGIKGYEDSSLSKQVADAVGVKNYYINYDTPQARKVFKTDFKNYALYACGLGAVPSMQEWYAVSELVRQKIIDEDCVFMPGYGGILPGHYIKDSMLNADADEIEGLISQKLKEFASQKPRATKEEVEECLDMMRKSSCFETLNEDSSVKDYIECYERFIYMEEQVKHIQNSTRNYEYVNCEWLSAFFFKEQYDLWAQIDNTLRLNNAAFMCSIEKYMLPQLNAVPFTGSKVERKNSGPKSRIKKLTDFLFKRTKVHYMFGMFPYTTYYKYFMKDLYVKINYTVCMEMLELLKK